MMRVTLDDAVLDMAERAGEHLEVRDNGSTIWFSVSLETISEITHGDGSYHVVVIDRGERGKLTISSPDVTHIEKYLIHDFGQAVRHKLGLPALAVIGDLPLPEGMSLDARSDGRYVLTWEDDGASHEVTFHSRLRARSFAAYARAGLSEVEASVLSPDSELPH